MLESTKVLWYASTSGVEPLPCTQKPMAVNEFTANLTSTVYGHYTQFSQALASDLAATTKLDQFKPVLPGGYLRPACFHLLVASEVELIAS